jgi:PadR family transcriptional regulator, regulatory protein PadR
MTHQNRELLKGSLDLMLLALLDTEPMYGYRLAKEVKGRSGSVLQLKEGSLYPALHRLERAGLIEGFWQTNDEGMNRRYYKITPQGREVLPQKRQEWNRFVNAVQGVLEYA